MAKVKIMKRQEMWDLLDRGDFIRWDEEYWVKTNKLEKEINNCSCLACEVQRAFNHLKIQGSSKR